MGYYRPRPSEVKNCKHCAIPFETNHKRAIYCGESCRVLAYQLRHGLSGHGGHDQEPKAKKAAGKLDFSLHNTATIAAGVLAADATKAGLNALFGVEPTNRAILDEIKALRQENQALRAKFTLLTAKVDRVAGFVGDAKHGIAALDPSARAAIVGSEQRHKALPPGSPNTGH